MRKYILLVLLFFSFHWAFGQELVQDTLRFQDFLEWVRAFHPVSKQADITLEMGAMEVRTARGGFDPLIYGNLDQKTYKSTDYYDRREAGVTIPTMAGIELLGTFEQNTGQFLDPENIVPSGGLFSAGAAVNIGQGLILDERRAALQQAKIYQQSTEAERLALLNELYLKGADTYWKWSESYSNMKAFEEAVRLTRIRYDAVKRSFEQGDVAAIDTVEAYTQLLSRQYRLQGLQNQFFVQTQMLSAFLWNEEEEPMILQEQVIPQPLSSQDDFVINNEELRTLVANHPQLRIADFELASLDVERRLKSQSMLPVVKLKYNFLVESIDGFEQAPFFENNYKFGVSFYTPILWRKARGSVGLAKAKIDFKQNSRDLKELELRNKLEAEINSWNTYNMQVQTVRENVNNLERLLSAEMRKFEMGESSLFLVNAREVSVFDARITLNGLEAKRKIAFAKVRYASGIGFE
ncbi:TolC family protein [Algoriphagus kandeliae]|uniref:TolC family protein n=1 Tax=Algoriphagus kandeliae TaxID=2562278 RepID=A0A4Y9R2N0_9BACT|nr:TolC family protein [Algoriphagus kandeliae]TFV97746.1 TolC family protein [Algoriphagus kandeliae]